jgi:Domain of unknown function (DUF4389)
MNEHPVHLVVSDDLRRNRLTVFLRLLLGLPHLVWLIIWGMAAFVATITNWLATLVGGRSPEPLHRFLASYVRYVIHVAAYLFLVADRFPDFLGRPGYPIDVAIAPPSRQNRWKVAFRLVLAVPALLYGAALSSTGARTGGAHYGGGLLGTGAFLGWFTALARGRTTRGLRDATAYALAYSAQLDAYLLLLTDRYPNADPLLALDDLPVREDPLRLEVDDDLRRSRLTVFFRLLLALPHLVWLEVWGILALLAVIANWLATLLMGRPPASLHRFLSAYLRYQTHVYAYLHLLANPFPGFTGKVGSYPVQLLVDEPRVQNRWTVVFRIPLAIPALFLAGAYGGVALTAAVLGWFASLVTGAMPRGLRNGGALAVRYMMQTAGYLFVLTADYPYSAACLNPSPGGLAGQPSGPSFGVTPG